MSLWGLIPAINVFESCLDFGSNSTSSLARPDTHSISMYGLKLFTTYVSGDHWSYFTSTLRRFQWFSLFLHSDHCSSLWACWYDLAFVFWFTHAV